MNLAVFLAIGESFQDFKNKGQDTLIINNNLRYYSINFDNVYVFSYQNESFRVFDNVIVIPNKYKLHRFIYAIFLPFINYSIIKKCNVIRGYQLTGGIPALVAKIFFQKEYVINYGYNYSMYAKLEGRKFIPLFIKLITWPVLYFANYVIATTDLLKRQIIKYNKNSVVIPNGVDIRQFKPIDLNKTIDVLYIGRLEKQKNLEILIKAISKLENDRLKVLFIGTGSLEKYLYTLSKIYNVKLQIIPRVSNSKLPLYINKSKVFILPSLIEGNPKALLEAMACGIAVIGNNVFGIRQIINGNNGKLFNQSVKSLSKLIGDLLNNENVRLKIGIQARNYIIKNFNLDITFNREILLLKEI